MEYQNGRGHSVAIFDHFANCTQYIMCYFAIQSRGGFCQVLESKLGLLLTIWVTGVKYI